MRLICSAGAKVDELFAMAADLSEYDRHHHRVLIGDLAITKVICVVHTLQHL